MTADALYIRLRDGEFQCRVVRLTDDVALDFAEEDQLVGIEILGASRLFERPDSPAVDLQDVLPRIVWLPAWSRALTFRRAATGEVPA